jgi:integrase
VSQSSVDCVSARYLSVRVLRIEKLDIQRRHLKSCSKFGTAEECPSALKKKCPYRVFGVGLSESGKRIKIRKSLKTNDQRVAIEQRNAMLIGQREVSNALTLEHAMTRYFREEKARGVSDETLKSFHKFLDRQRDEQYTPTLIMWCEKHGIRAIDAITQDTLKEWRAAWKVGPKTSRKQWERVRQFFRYANDAGWIETDPAQKIRNVIDRNKDIPVVALSEAELKAIFEACRSPFLTTFMEVMLASGLAIVDAIQLAPDRLEWRYLVLRRTKTGASVKVPLDGDLVAKLKTLPLLEGGFWFWNRKGEDSSHQTATGNMRRRLRPIFDKAGIHAHPHQFRHTFVSRCLAKGMPIEMIADLLGDSIKIVASTYAHFIADRQRAIDKFLVPEIPIPLSDFEVKYGPLAWRKM